VESKKKGESCVEIEERAILVGTYYYSDWWLRMNVSTAYSRTYGTTYTRLPYVSYSVRLHTHFGSSTCSWFGCTSTGERISGERFQDLRDE
jgi:hypothetical protein